MQLTELEAHRHTATTRSGEISYLDVGTGPVALFIHGVASNAYLWRHVIGALAAQRRCIALDLPLHGHSPVTAEQDLSLAALAAGLDDFCEVLGLTGIDLVANDTGGAIAQIFAARHPQRLATLTLTNCDTADNLPPEAFKPMIELAAAGHLAPSAVAMFADLDTAAQVAVRLRVRAPGPGGPGGDPLLPGTVCRDHGTSPPVRAAAGRPGRR